MPAPLLLISSLNFKFLSLFFTVLYSHSYRTVIFFLCLQKSSVAMEDGLVQDEFSESVKMSTYLVAFVVGELKNLSQDINGTLVCCSGIYLERGYEEFFNDFW